MTYSLFIGRFQPFHNGHLQVIQELIAKGEKVLIAIGSSQVSHTQTDPLTANERLTIIKNALTEANISTEDYWLIPVQDINQNQLWVNYLKTTLPPFTKAYSGSTLVKQLFTENKATKFTELPRYKEISATKIRNLIAANNPKWETYVPKAVAIFLKTNQLTERIQNLIEPS